MLKTHNWRFGMLLSVVMNSTYLPHILHMYSTYAHLSHCCRHCLRYYRCIVLYCIYMYVYRTVILYRTAVSIYRTAFPTRSQPGYDYRPIMGLYPKIHSHYGIAECHACIRQSYMVIPQTRWQSAIALIFDNRIR